MAQQVAGAAGTALFVTVMTRRSVAGVEAGASVVEATAEGVHAALFYGGVISAVAQPTPTPNTMAGNRMIMLRLS